MINISVPLVYMGGGIQYISSRTKYTIEEPREKSSSTEQMTSAIMTIVVNESVTS